MKKWFSVFGLSVLLAFCTGCSNLFSVPKSDGGSNGAAESASDRSVQVTGRLSLGGAAMPAFSAEGSADQMNFRTAAPEVKKSALSYRLSAKSGALTRTIDQAGNEFGKISVESGVITYSIKLSEGSWSLTAEALSDTTPVLRSPSASVTITKGLSKTADLTISDYVPNSEGGSGSIELTITKAEDVPDADVDLEKTALTLFFASGEGSLVSEGSYELSTKKYSATVSPGTYRLEILFKDSVENPVFFVQEFVHVYSGCKTDYFFNNGTADYIKEGRIELTRADVDAAKNFSDVYVKSSGNDANRGTRFDPVKTLDRAIQLANGMTSVAQLSIIVQSDVSMNDSATITKDVTLQSEAGKRYTVRSKAITVSADGVQIKSLDFDANNEAATITVSSGKTLTVTESTIQNVSSALSGGAFYVSGTLNLGEGAVVKDCSATLLGGGVYVSIYGTLTLSGAVIQGCTATGGGGVYVSPSGTLTLNEGTLIKNNRTSSGNGGGVSNNGILTVKGGEISGNEAPGGGGVYNSNLFTMTGGEISGNEASGNGGGVYNIDSFTMTGGEIGGNSTTGGSGGGVYSDEVFSMSGGALVSGSNDVYLASGTTIRVTESLTGEAPFATITPSVYTAGTAVLSGSAVSAEHEKFAVTTENDGTEWVIDGAGKIKRVMTYKFHESVTSAGTVTIDGREYKLVYFGDWPRTIKAEGVTIDTAQSETHGIFTYYAGSDGNWYVECVENGYDDDDYVYRYSDGTAVAFKTANTKKFFRVEPIKWRVLTDNYGGKSLLFAEEILTAHRYDASKNNYKNSEIRSWLNGAFWNTAFTSSAQGLVDETTVDNTKESTNPQASPTLWNGGNNPYSCENTDDKIFLLSQKEATTAAYGFDSYDAMGAGNARIRVTTDFAKANYAWQSSTFNYGGWWWLRSPLNYADSGAQDVSSDGDASDNGHVDEGDGGVVPALSMDLLI